jgi:hypothetical protein
MDMPEDFAREEAYAELVDQISQQAVDGFTSVRLRSYYLAHPDLAVGAIALYREAKSLISSSPSAALVLFVTSIEVGLKVALLKPVAYGLVHNDSVADLVSNLVVKHNGWDRFTGLLSRLLREYGNIDLEEFTIDGHSKTLWEEFAMLQRARNALVHRAEPATSELAALAQEVAVMIFGNYLNSVLQGLGMKLVKGGRIAPAQQLL